MGVIPLSETLGSETNIFTCISLLLALPLFFFWLGKRLPPGAVRLPDFSAPGPEPGPVREGAPAPGLEPGPGSTRSPAPNSLLPHTAQDSAQQADHTQSAVPAGFSFPWRSAGRIAAALFAALILVAVGLRFAESESKGSLRFLTLDFINLALLGLGLLLHGSFSRYAEAAEKAMPGAAGIAIQFPFYFGIMGLMQDFGLVAWMAQGFVELSTAQTFPLFGLLSAGLVNFFVPSGGGQWQVQGPVLIEAARALGVPDWKAIMALSYGDQLTNMLQPFWALPLLGITGLSARDILPYTAMAMLLGLVIFAVALTLF
ncbi:MAG: hypothetical protein GC205_04170 [Bacteroidetes bacterium]|nr:hypothetical protein [Bacteroidota bacterium]